MSTLPIGLALQPDVITPEKEQEIISWLDTRAWSMELARRTQHYGYGYNYRSKKLVPGPVLEGPVLEISQLLQSCGLMNPVQCIVNEYTRNQGIAAHIDNLTFGPMVVGLSVGEDAVMIFERTTPTVERFECFLPRRSIVQLSGPARYEWKHSIEKKVTYMNESGTKITKSANYRRISLTYRELAQ